MIARLLSLLLINLMALAQAWAEKQIYTSIAVDSKSTVVYKEKHTAEFLDGKIKTAQTEYSNSEGKLIGLLESDFRVNVAVPSYTYKDLRSESSHGISFEDGKYVVWRQEKDGKREQKIFRQSDFSDQALIVGCQGLHYYLIDHLPSVKEKKQVSIKYLMPGALDYYSFTLTFAGEDSDYVHLKLKVDNVILRLFTSELKLKYRKADLRLVEYSGLSNIVDDRGEMQNVVIKYTYRII